MRSQDLYQQMRAAGAVFLPPKEPRPNALALHVLLLRAIAGVAVRVGVVAGIVLGSLTFVATAALDAEVLNRMVSGATLWFLLSLVHVVGVTLVAVMSAVVLTAWMIARRTIWHRRYWPAVLSGAVSGVYVLAVAGLTWTSVRPANIPVFGGLDVFMWFVLLVIAVWVWHVVDGAIDVVMSRTVPPPLARETHVFSTLAQVFGLVVLVFVVFVVLSANRTQALSLVNDRPAETMHIGPERRVIVLGIDGLSWDEVRVGIGDSSLTNWDAIERVGARGRLYSDASVGPATFWTTAATGMRPQDHGVHGVTQLTVRTAGAPLAIGAGHAPFYQLYSNAFRAIGLTSPVPVSRHAIRRWTAWEVVRQAGAEAGVIGWWGAWPGEGESGTLDMAALAPQEKPFKPFDLDDRVGEGLRAILHRSPRPSLTMAYFPGLDLMQRRGGTPGADRMAHRAWLDAIIGEAAAALGPEDLLLVIADPGARRERGADFLTTTSDDGGVVLAAASAIEPATRLAQPRIEDLWPTIAWWLGLPPAEDWAGDAWIDLRPGLELAPAISTYGQPAREAKLDRGPAAQRLAQLRLAGYLD